MVDKVERLINLTVALLETRRPLTLSDIRARVAGYDHDDPESARRMFERDKSELRDLSIPIETVPIGLGEGEWGYTIDRSAYELPPVELASDEVAALAVALEVAGEDRARLGLRKIGALAPDPRSPEVPPAAIETALGDLPGLAAAIIERRSLTFGYRDARGSSSRRTVDPYGLGQRGGSWYLVAWDHDRSDLRVFRLDRITDDPEPVGGAGGFEVPDGLDVGAAIRGPEAEGVELEVAVAPEVAWRLARGGERTAVRDDGWVEVTVTGADLDRVLPRVLTLGSRAEVLAPAAARRAAAKRLLELGRGEGEV